MIENTLFYGDNLDILREHIDDESVDLIYLDPPFNSNRSYNVLFRDESGRDSDAQITAFEDSWHWGRGTEGLYADLVNGADERLVRLLTALVGGKDEGGLLGRNQMSAYLVMMAARLAELHRVLRPTGSLYLHCDPTASHYLKLVLDAVFGKENLITEIIWKRTTAHSDTKQGAKQPGRIHDVIYFYAKDVSEWTWNPVYTPYSEDYKEKFYRYIEDESGRRYTLSDLTAAKPGGDTEYEWRGAKPYEGRFWAYSKENMEKFEREGRLHYTKSGTPRYKRYLDEMPGVHIQSIWDDIMPIRSRAAERLGYPTQKPLALLERIIRASSNPGDVVLDPFCGCGTAIDAAHSLGRRWLGIDITHLSVALMKYRLRDRHDLRPGRDYRVIGEPQDLAGARNLAQEQEHDGRYQFQWWALSLVGARPLGASGGSRKGKKGADGGVDGLIHFLDEDGRAQRVVVQVKSGGVGRRDIGDLRGLLDGGAAMALFITLQEPTRPMQQEAISAGHYESELWGRFPRLQLLTIEQLLDGTQPELPRGQRTFRQAARAREERDEPGRLL